MAINKATAEWILDLENYKHPDCKIATNKRRTLITATNPGGKPLFVTFRKRISCWTVVIDVDIEIDPDTEEEDYVTGICHFWRGMQANESNVEFWENLISIQSNDFVQTRNKILETIEDIVSGY